jgi:hypothetical protein
MEQRVFEPIEQIEQAQLSQTETLILQGLVGSSICDKGYNPRHALQIYYRDQQ